MVKTTKAKAKASETYIRVEHTLSVLARCPVNESRDVYETTFRLDKLVKVETLIEQCRGFQDKKLFQEELTELLAQAFGCEVETRGIHSGVKTVCVAGVWQV